MCDGATVQDCIGLWLQAAQADVESFIPLMLEVGVAVWVGLWSIRFGWRLVSGADVGGLPGGTDGNWCSICERDSCGRDHSYGGM